MKSKSDQQHIDSTIKISQNNHHINKPKQNQSSQQLQNSFNYNQQFFYQYQKTYNIGLHLSAEMEQLVALRDQLWGQLAKLQQRTTEFKDIYRGQPIEKKRRSRRGADQIDRIYKCKHSNCGKSYGSQGSLNQHLRLKHPGDQQYQSNYQNNEQQQYQLSVKRQEIE